MEKAATKRVDATALDLRSLDEIGAVDAGRFGSKASNLGQLLRWGNPVPIGFVVAFPGIHADCLQSSEWQVIRSAYWQLVEAECDNTSRSVAARSSAIGEDSAERSFAGQYVTELNIDGEAELREAIESCLRSRHSQRVQVYQPDTEQAGMGVIVQRMATADFAGVAFSHSPTHRDHALIEVVTGLGDKLVSGAQRPAQVIVESNSLRLTTMTCAKR